MPERKTVMISSTARDLPEHRQEALDACLRQGMFPVMMEHLPASDDEAISASLAMVDGADIYVGIFAHRYGHVPMGHPISVTEMEYNRAVERKIPRLIFVMDKAHPITIDQVELGEAAVKLEAFKQRLLADNIVNFFKSPADLRALVINSLSQLREPDLTAFHYISDIPAPPEAYIAHPYTLLQTHRLVGRQAELNLLTNWVTGKTFEVSETSKVSSAKVSIFNIVAIGGMGKSALAWKWFNEIAPQEMVPLAGRMWWSFYESDATFENFVIRALAYVTGRAREEIEKNVRPGEREEQLLAALDRAPFLLVLDGLERILIAYARMDAARLTDDDFDRQTANVVAGAYGLPVSAARSFVGQHRLRKTADLRAGAFLRKLAGVRASRVLVSTRLYPADLQAMTGAPCPGCFALFLRGLGENDALELWRAFGVSGGRETLLPLFASFERHPLLIQALASQVARYRPAPGDFERWRRDHPGFSPFDLPLVQVRSHVLDYALRGLDEKSLDVLRTIAAFRMPVRYDTLAALFIDESSEIDKPPNKLKDTSQERPKPFVTDRDLDAALTELEDRGLLGWDRRANRYDLHPIVRGVAWNGLDAAAQRGLYAGLHDHFESLPKLVNWQQVESLEDLTPAIELYNTLIGLGRYDDAAILLYERIRLAMLYRLSTSRQLAELLEELFPDGPAKLPRLSKQEVQAHILSLLAQAYLFSGKPGRAAPLFQLHNDIQEKVKSLTSQRNLSIGLRNLSYAVGLAGGSREAEATALRSLLIMHQIPDRCGKAVSLRWLGLALAARGAARPSELILQRSLCIFTARPHAQGQGVVSSFLAQRALWFGDPTALSLADQAWELACSQRQERDFIRAARLQGAALGLQDYAKADERLHHALARARAVNLVEEELPALVALAELRRRQGELRAARELLDDIWEPAERGPYPLFHADAYNVLAQIERDAGSLNAAVAAATKAYRLGMRIK